MLKGQCRGWYSQGGEVRVAIELFKHSLVKEVVVKVTVKVCVCVCVCVCQKLLLVKICLYNLISDTIIQRL